MMELKFGTKLGKTLTPSKRYAQKWQSALLPLIMHLDPVNDIL